MKKLLIAVGVCLAAAFVFVAGAGVLNRWNRGDPVVAQGREQALIEVDSVFKDALTRNREAWARFERLPASHQSEYDTWIRSAKKTATKDRRVKAAIKMMLGKKTTSTHGD